MASEFSSQGWNRYSYVGNNPLAYTDPSGMCFLGCFFKRIFHSPIFRPLVAIAAAATFQYYVLPALEVGAGLAASTSALSTTSLVANGVIGGAIGGAIAGNGNPQAVLAGAFTAGAFGGLNAPSLGLTGIEKIAAFGVAGGVGSVIGGANFQSGFLAAGTTAFVMPYLPNLGPIGNTLEVAAVGGTASVIGGGRFGNGALTAAFAYLASNVAANAGSNENGPLSQDPRETQVACLGTTCPDGTTPSEGVGHPLGTLDQHAELAGTLLGGRLLGPLYRIGAFLYDLLPSAPTEINLTNTVESNAASRPFVNSPLTVGEIMSTGQGVPDPGGIPGALRYDVPGTYNKAQGTYELVIDPKTNTVYHFLFTTK